MVAEVVQRHEGPSPKSLELEKILGPNTQYFVTILRFVANYALFGNLWTKKSFCFQSKTVFLGQEVHYYMEYIA